VGGGTIEGDREGGLWDQDTIEAETVLREEEEGMIASRGR
jgi:hypothetical protein